MDRSELANPKPHEYLSRGIDYLEDLSLKLRDLQGYATLAHELIQNADDADGQHGGKSATWFSLDITDQALIADNDGTFSDCEHMELPDCPWRNDPAIGHRCDFHRFRHVAGGDKRQQEGTTGAFGVGFIAVYQITDRPELISRGRHWIIDEAKSEKERIAVCPGCPTCADTELPGTRFILPWADDPESELRRGLRAEAVDAERIERLAREIQQVLPQALLFLKRINRITIRRNGETQVSLECLREDDKAIIDAGRSAQLWYTLHGRFPSEAAALKAKHPGRIEAKRRDEVSLAIPEIPSTAGLFYASLPTQLQTGFPFHINADFFPTSDRKGIILEQDYQSEWNRAAIRAAAATLAASLISLPEKLGRRSFWGLIASIEQVAREVDEGKRRSELAQFWRLVLPQLKEMASVYTTSGCWVSPSSAFLVPRKEKDASVAVLEALGLPLVHFDLLPYHNILVQIGVQPLEITDLANALKGKGLDKRTEIKDLPSFLNSEEALSGLWREIDRLLDRYPSGESRRDAAQPLLDCALAVGRDHALWPIGRVLFADEETVDVFSPFVPNAVFLADSAIHGKTVPNLVSHFDASTAIDVLGQLGKTHLENAKARGALDPTRVLGWFEERRSSVLADSDIKRRLAACPIFPSSGRLAPLTELALPGDFTDPLGLADIVEIESLGGRRDFLRELGARDLNFEEYARVYIPRAFTGDSSASDRKRKAVDLLVQRLGEIKGKDDVRSALASSAIIECTDGVYRRPGQVYLPNEIVSTVIGSNAPLAVIPPPPSEETTLDLYKWLGVSEQPRYPDILRRIRELVTKPPEGETIALVSTIFKHLGERLKKNDRDEEVLQALREMAWLPAEGDRSRWYQPRDVRATFSKHLFYTQGRFLDISLLIQSSSVELLQALEIGSEPTTLEVVKHLLECSHRGSPVNKAVYSALANNADDPAILLLQDTCCLLLPGNVYVKPSQVFWGDHPFGKYRHRLASSELRSYQSLFDRLGVKESPDHLDAYAVILEIEAEYNREKKPLDADQLSVVMNCWRMLEEALLREQISPESLLTLAERRVIPNARHMLNQPRTTFFEDRAGLAARFGPQIENLVISREAGVWRAMRAAGVRTLVSAVHSHLVECTDPVPDDAVAPRIRQRVGQIARVFESLTDDPNSRPDLRLLTEMECLSVVELRIQYTLTVLGRGLSSNIDITQAHYHSETQTLYFLRSDSQPPWVSVARELALALCPDGEPGPIASSLKEVLSANTVEEACAVLDELGFAPAEVFVNIEMPEAAHVDELGGETGAPTIYTTAPQPSTFPPIDGQGTDDLTPGEAVRRILDDAAGEPTAMPVGLGSDERAKGPAPAHPRSLGELGQSRERVNPYPKYLLRSYVVPAGTPVTPAPPGQAERRAQTENAGLQRVVEFEQNAGRYPRVMPTHHPGYDLESCDAQGGVLRYIEVKALSGDWWHQQVDVTRTEFEKARELGGLYWLYVVERAEEDDFVIHRIPNPALRVDRYLYDDGWSSVAEPIEPAEGAPEIPPKQDG